MCLFSSTHNTIKAIVYRATHSRFLFKCVGATAAYLMMAFVKWDWLFFTESESSRVALLLAMMFGGCFGAFPVIEYSVEVDSRNRRQRLLHGEQ